MLSPAARLISATGTYRPSIWQLELPNWILAMSRRPGTSPQPEWVALTRTSSAAPQLGQLNWLPSVTVPHHAHTLACGGAAVVPGIYWGGRLATIIAFRRHLPSPP